MLISHLLLFKLNLFEHSIQSLFYALKIMEFVYFVLKNRILSTGMVLFIA